MNNTSNTSTKSLLDIVINDRYLNEEYSILIIILFIIALFLSYVQPSINTVLSQKNHRKIKNILRFKSVGEDVDSSRNTTIV